jgi:hypothetical protein
VAAPPPRPRLETQGDVVAREDLAYTGGDQTWNLGAVDHQDDDGRPRAMRGVEPAVLVGLARPGRTGQPAPGPELREIEVRPAGEMPGGALRSWCVHESAQQCEILVPVPKHDRVLDSWAGDEDVVRGGSLGRRGHQKRRENGQKWHDPTNHVSHYTTDLCLVPWCLPTARGATVARGVQRSLLLIVLASLLATLLAACSSGEPSTYKADPTAQCLRKLGYRVTTIDQDVGVVAAAAPNGGLRAFEPGNTVTIAFGANQDDALKIEGAFRRFAPKKLRPNIDDVMRLQKNAVLLWTVTPPEDEMNKVFGCLKG